MEFIYNLRAVNLYTDEVKATRDSMKLYAIRNI